MKRNPNRHAFFLADVVTGIAILGTLLGVFAAALGESNSAANKLSDARAAWRMAEGALAEAQAGHRTTTAEMRPVAGGHAPAGFVWIEAVVRQGGQEARLIGLVPKAVGAGS